MIDIKAIRESIHPDCYGFAEIDAEALIALCDEIEGLRKDAARYKKLVAMEADLVEPITIWHYLRNPGDLDAAMEAKQ